MRDLHPYIADTVITFEEEPVSVEDMRSRIANVIPALPWLVYERDGGIVGYAYATGWRVHSAYRFAVESTVYLTPACQRQGIGRRLYSELITDLRARGKHCVIGGVALPNEASVRLHESLGFQKVAQFREVGFKFGRWIDVAYWELMLQTAT